MTTSKQIKSNISKEGKLTISIDEVEKNGKTGDIILFKPNNNFNVVGFDLFGSKKKVKFNEKLINSMTSNKSDLIDDEEEDIEDKKPSTEEIESQLEERVASVRLPSRFEPNPSEEAMAQHHYDQVLALSKQPMMQLYSQMKTIYDTSVQEGYVSGPIVAQTFEIESAIERKLQDVDAGNYQFTNEETAKAASASLAMKRLSL